MYDYIYQGSEGKGAQISLRAHATSRSVFGAFGSYWFTRRLSE